MWVTITDWPIVSDRGVLHPSVGVLYPSDERGAAGRNCRLNSVAEQLVILEWHGGIKAKTL